jgi:hypothetical protein
MQEHHSDIELRRDVGECLEDGVHVIVVVFERSVGQCDQRIHDYQLDVVVEDRGLQEISAFSALQRVAGIRPVHDFERWHVHARPQDNRMLHIGGHSVVGLRRTQAALHLGEPVFGVINQHRSSVVQTFVRYRIARGIPAAQDVLASRRNRQCGSQSHG